MILLLLVAPLSARPAAAQTAARVEASVRVHPVAWLDVLQSAEPLSASRSPSVRIGEFRLHVRANHRWRVLVAVTDSTARELWVRTDAVGDEPYRRLVPGRDLEVAAGPAGDAVVRLEYRWHAPPEASRREVPLTYTLAASED